MSHLKQSMNNRDDMEINKPKHGSTICFISVLKVHNHCKKLLRTI